VQIGREETFWVRPVGQDDVIGSKENGEAFRQGHALAEQ
jgi:hypothetical protein